MKIDRIKLLYYLDSKKTSIIMYIDILITLILLLKSSSLYVFITVELFSTMLIVALFSVIETYVTILSTIKNRMLRSTTKLFKE